jgi:serine/threonine protein kinase
MAQNHLTRDELSYDHHKGVTRTGTEVDVLLEHPQRSAAIGQGAFAQVYKLRSKVGGRATELIALKSPIHASFPTEEADLLRELDHENVVTMKYSFMDGGLKENFAMELLEDGDLYSLLQEVMADQRTFWRKQDELGIYVEVFSYQLFRGLAYLASIGLIHRDIKSENLLISRTAGHLKITDFGCATFMETDRDMPNEVGTKEFRAPEMLLGSTRYTPSVDVW